MISLKIFEIKKVEREALYFKSKDEMVNVSKGDLLKIEGSMYEGKVLIDKFEKIN